MQFLSPYFLLLLFVPFGLYINSLSKKVLSIEKLFSKEILNQLRYKKELLNSTFRYRLFLLALSFMIIGVAHPVVEQKNFSVSSIQNSIIIALDMSKSMQKTDIYPSREALGEQKLLEILKLADGLNIGILFYAKNAYVVYPLSRNTNVISSLLKNRKIEKKFSDNTNLFAALEGSKYMLRGEHQKNIILLSDGGEDISREKELNYLQEEKIRLYTLALTERKNLFLKILSEESGGDYIKYSWGSKDIEQLLYKINLQTKTKIKQTYPIKHYKEYFIYPLLIALFLLLIIYQPSLKLLKFTIVFCIFTLNSHTTLNAAVLDFWHIHKAKEFYNSAKYKLSAQEYSKVASNPSGYYNYANALYKSKEYLKAIQMYKKAVSDDKLLNAKIYHNIANANLQRGKLESAKIYLIKALKEHKFMQTEENLAVVLKELQRRKKLLSSKQIKIRFKNRLKQNEVYPITSSTYSIQLEKLLLNEEQKWMQLISKRKTPLFLQKIPTRRSSADAKVSY